MTLEAGTRLGAYEILGLIGAGGMGEVYRARDTRLHRTVAIKILPREWREDADRLKRFEQEARAAGALNHPNILAVHDVGADRAQPFVVTELLEGETVRSRLATGPLPPRKAIEYARQIAQGLGAAHDGGIVHRDLKPENLFITKDGRVKVLDFGLAKLAIAETGTAAATETASTLQTAAGVVMGTAAYMSPEQARGLPADARSDIFAFGAVLYEMLLGRRAFPGDSPVDVLSAILTSDPAPIDRKGVSPAIERVVRRCLEKNPDERFQSARDLAFALEAIENTGSGESGAAFGASGDVRRTRFAAAAGVAALAAAVAAGIAIDRLALTPSENSAPRFSRVFRFTSTPAAEYAPAISPDGTWVAFVSHARDVADVWVKFVAGGEAANLTAGSGLELQSRALVGGLDITPDGTAVAVLARPVGSAGPFTLWLIPAPLPGAPRKLLDSTSGVRWSPDGTRLAIVRAGSASGDALLVAGADGSNGRELIPRQAGVHLHWPAWSSNGRYIYYQRAPDPYSSEPSEIFRVPTDGGSPEPVVRTARRAVFPAPAPDGTGLVYAANPESADLELWWRSEDGRHSQRLTTGVGEYAEPRVSADGRFVVATRFELFQSLELLHLDRPNAFRALTDGHTGDLDPNVAPQGDLLVFSSSRLGSRTLWVANPDGSRPRPLTTGSNLDERPVFSPDGRTIAFVSARGNERGIWIVSRDGGPPRKLASATVINTLSWSPDGRQIVFSAVHENRPRLEVLTLADGTRRVIPTPGDATAPAWSPDGRLIAYLLDRGDLAPRTQLLVLTFVTPEGGSGDLLKGDYELGVNFNNGEVAWAPDGRRLALVTLVGSAPAAIWLFDPEATPSFRKLIELPPGPRLRGLTWTPDGSSIIVGKHDALSDIVLFERSR